MSLEVLPIGSVDGNKLLSSPRVRRMYRELGTRSGDAIKRRVKEFVESRDGYTEFAIAFGHNSKMSHGDVEYIWNRLEKEYGTNEDSYENMKKLLGTLLMAYFALDPRKWMGVMDMDRRDKMDRGEIPSATKYFLI